MQWIVSSTFAYNATVAAFAGCPHDLLDLFLILLNTSLTSRAPHTRVRGRFPSTALDFVDRRWRALEDA